MLCVFAAPVAAQERARDYIEPRVSKTQFQQFLQQVGAQSDQRQIANLAFSDYESSLDELAKRLDEQALAAGRQAVDNSLSGKARLPAEELSRLRVEVQKVYLQAGPEVDSALDILIGGVEALLTDEQLPKFQSARRWLHREVLLHPRASASTYQEYAGDGVDVLALVEAARGEGGELATFSDDVLADILAEYELHLDAVLMQTASAQRQGNILRKIASISKDQETLKREEQAALQRWQRLYELNQQTVNQIADVAQAMLGEVGGDEAAAAFRKRFDHESFAWLYPRRKPDRQIEWLRTQPQIPPETLKKAEGVYADYLQKRDGLSRSAIEMMLKARLEFQTFLYAMMDRSAIDERVRGGLYEDLLKNTGEQSHLESSTSSALEALLDDQQRQALRDAMKRPDRTPRAAPK